MALVSIGICCYNLSRWIQDPEIGTMFGVMAGWACFVGFTAELTARTIEDNAGRGLDS